MVWIPDSAQLLFSKSQDPMIVMSINGKDVWIAQNFTQNNKEIKKQAIINLLKQLMENSKYILTPNIDLDV